MIETSKRSNFLIIVKLISSMVNWCLIHSNQTCLLFIRIQTIIEVHLKQTNIYGLKEWFWQILRWSHLYRSFVSSQFFVWAFWINVLIKRRKSFIFMFVSFSNIAVSGYYFFSSERSNDTCNIHKPIFISSSFHELLDILSCLLKVQLSLIWNYVRVESIPTSWFCYISPCVVSKLKIRYFLQK